MTTAAPLPSQEEMRESLEDPSVFLSPKGYLVLCPALFGDRFLTNETLLPPVLPTTSDRPG